MLRISKNRIFELACFGNFGFLSKRRKLTVSYRPEIVFFVILVLKPAVIKLTKQANLISIADAVIFQNIGNYQSFFPSREKIQSFLWSHILLSKTVEFWVLFNLQQDIYTATVRVAFGCITLRIKFRAI